MVLGRRVEWDGDAPSGVGLAQYRDEVIVPTLSFVASANVRHLHRCQSRVRRLGCRNLGPESRRCLTGRYWIGKFLSPQVISSVFTHG